MNNIYTVPELQKALFPVFERHGVRSATLFGSYGKGLATEKSDIDILVDSGLRGLRFVGLLNDIQKTTGKDIDLLDVTHITPGSLIDREIHNSGVSLYAK